MIEPTSSSSYYSDKNIRKSWYFEGSHISDLRIDIEAIWDDYIGTGIKIGVTDSQIDFAHEDLSKAYDASLDYHFSLDTDAPTRGDANADRHGSLVAGIISSEADNGVGTAGIAHGATLVGLAFNYSDENIVSHVLSALTAGAALDVVNASWSFSNSFADNFAKSPNYEAPLLLNASEGRGGLGTTVVFAAGNEGKSGSSNYHNFQNSPFTIAVGAVERDGDPASFTSLGANVLLSAAGDNVFSTGPNNAYGPASGTSFAAPAVSAVAALMLEANGQLGYRDVQQILAASAMREGLTDKKLHGDGWQYTGTTTHNGGGMHFSDAFGFGFLNAHAAVRLAETWTLQQTYANRSTVTESVKTDLLMRAGEIDHVSTSFDIDEAILAEHVQVTLGLTWAQNGDIDVYLTSPTGTSVRLIYDLPDVARVGTITDFAFTSVASMGEMATGTWTVDVYNRNPDATNRNGQLEGRLRSVDVEIHGRTENLEDDVYIFTDEFGTLFTGQDLTDRSTLSDDDGGTDTINAAAVTSNTVVDLSGVSDTTIAGVKVDLRPGDFENVFTGDGNDIITGDAGANWLSSGRGDDILFFSGGSDTLDGGAGTDRLVLEFEVASALSSFDANGTVLIGLAGFGESMVTGIEVFEFADAVLSISDLPGFSGAPFTPPADPIDPPQDDPIDPPVVEPVDPPADDPADDVPVSDPANPPTDAPSDQPSFETDVVGGATNDILIGTDANDRIEGLGGADRLFGKSGSDLIIGGDGNDILYGDNANDGNHKERQADTFVFDSNDGNDRVFDFEGAYDTIALVEDAAIGSHTLTQMGGGNLLLTYGLTEVILYRVGTFAAQDVVLSETPIDVVMVTSLDDLA